jgi:hypothetical protein
MSRSLLLATILSIVAIGFVTISSANALSVDQLLFSKGVHVNNNNYTTNCNLVTAAAKRNGSGYKVFAAAAVKQGCTVMMWIQYIDRSTGKTITTTQTGHATKTFTQTPTNVKDGSWINLWFDVCVYGKCSGQTSYSVYFNYLTWQNIG